MPLHWLKETTGEVEMIPGELPNRIFIEQRNCWSEESVPSILLEFFFFFFKILAEGLHQAKGPKNLKMGYSYPSHTNTCNLLCLS